MNHAENGTSDSAQFFLDQLLNKANPQVWVKATHDVGQIYEAQNAALALSHYQLNLKKAKAHFGAKDTIVAELNARIGGLYRKPPLRDYNKALTFFEKAIQIYGKQQVNHRFAGYVYYFAGAICTRLGSYETAKGYLKKAVEIRLDHQDLLLASRTYNDLGIVYLDLGEHALALQYYQAGESLLNGMQGPASDRQRGISMLNQADCLLVLKESEKAFPLLKQSQQVFTALNYTRGIAGVRKSLGDYYSQMGQASNAIDQYEQALIHQELVYGKSHRELSKTYVELGRLYKKGGRLNRALQNSQLALGSLIYRLQDTIDLANPERHELYPEPWIMISLGLKASIFLDRYQKTRHEKDLASAATSIDLALAQLDLLRDSYVHSGDKQWLFSQFNNLVKTGIVISSEHVTANPTRSHYNRLFRCMELGKAHAFLELFQEAEARQQCGLPDSLKAEERRLKMKLSECARTLNHSQESSAEKVLQEDLLKAQNELMRFSNYLHSRYPAYYELKFAPPAISIGEIQKQALDSASAIFEYAIADSQLFCFVILKDTSHLFHQQMGHSFQGLIQTVQTCISSVNRNASATKTISDFTHASHDLYKQMVAPGLAFIKSQGNEVHRLIFALDGALGYLPMEVLLTKPIAVSESKDFRDFPYLLRDFNTCYAYSSSTFLHQVIQRSGWQAEKSLLAVAPRFSGSNETGAGFATLNHTLKEAKEISEMLNGTVLLEREASKLHFQQQAADFRIIHLATHATLDLEKPLYSKLFFSGEAAPEALFLHELLQYELSADLAVLSACNTGRGELITGDGIMSLAKGFAYAGCPSVLMSLWQVNDHATATIAKGFYNELREGKAKDEALRLAKLDYLQTADRVHGHPFFWAGFVLQGNPLKMDLKTPSSAHNSFWYIILILTGIIWILLWRQLRRVR